MHRTWLALASGTLLTAVAFGAFGAHALKQLVGPEQVASWHTGVEYQFIHGLALLFLSTIGERIPRSWSRAIRWCFVGGIICFSGSIYLLSTREIWSSGGGADLLGPITPIGGLLFMAGWGLLLISAMMHRPSS